MLSLISSSFAPLSCNFSSDWFFGLNKVEQQPMSRPLWKDLIAPISTSLHCYDNWHLTFRPDFLWTYVSD